MAKELNIEAAARIAGVYSQKIHEHEESVRRLETEILDEIAVDARLGAGNVAESVKNKQYAIGNTVAAIEIHEKWIKRIATALNGAARADRPETRRALGQIAHAEEKAGEARGRVKKIYRGLEAEISAAADEREEDSIIRNIVEEDDNWHRFQETDTKSTGGGRSRLKISGTGQGPPAQRRRNPGDRRTGRGTRERHSRDQLCRAARAKVPHCRRRRRWSAGRKRSPEQPNRRPTGI